MGKQWTHEMFVDKVFELVGDEFKVVGRYEKNNIKIEMYHEKCKRHFFIRPADFKNRKRCSLCHGKFKKTTNQFKKQVSKLSNNEYEVLEEYQNDSTHIMMKHLVCGYTWKAVPSHFIQGKRCPKCAGNLKKTTIQFKKEVLELVGSEYSVIGEYKGAHKKVKFRHVSTVCDSHEFSMSPTDFLSGKRCNKCKVINQSGVNHWKFNPELTKEDRMKRDMQNGELRVWRQRVFKRDGYKCQICKKHSSNLNAHHLNSWDVHKEQRFLVINGISLCEDCHLSFHQKYGFGSNTKQQFEEFTASL